MNRTSALWKTFSAVAERYPRRRIVQAVEEARAWTARELRDRAARLREEADIELARGGCVAFSLPNGVDWLAAFLAAQAAGVAVLPLDPSAVPGDWRDAAGALGATHALVKRRLLPLKPRDRAVDWRRFAVAKMTSGSTGAPMVIPCSASHLMADGGNIASSMRIRPRDRNLAVLPLGHSYGLGNLVMPLILQGTSLVTAESYLPRQILEWIEKYRITVFPSVPVVLQILSEITDPHDLRSLRLVISAGAPLRAQTARDFFARFGRRVHNFYGSSETGGICFDASGTASLTGRSVGKPMHEVRVEIARNGRIRVASKAVAMRGGSHTLADLGNWTHGGELEITGRDAPMANIGGRKVSPLEIEAALLAIPGVSAAWVTVLRGVSRDYLGAVLESPRARAEIAAELADRIAKWKWPRHLIVTRELPRSARGKPDVPALKALVEAAVRKT